MTKREKQEQAAYKAVKDFVTKGKWPKPGVLPVCVRFNKGLQIR